MVKIDSVTGEEREMSDFALSYLLKMGLSAEKDSLGNIIAKNNGKGDPLFFSAHLDTVSPGKGIIPVIEKNTIKSKGNTILGGDNKAPLSAILEALFSTKTKRKIEIAFTVSEESENIGALKLDYSKIESKKGFCFDCGEKIGTIILKSPFYDSFIIDIKGKSSHAAFPEKGINAIKYSSDFIKKIKIGKINNSTVLNIGKIKGGSSVNTVPEKILMEGEIRSFSKKNIENTEKQLNAISLDNKKIKKNVKIKRENAGYIFKKNNRDVQSICKIMSKIKIDPLYKSSWACSDANIFNEKGIKVLNLGDGVENIHTTSEKIKIKNLILLTKLIKKIIKDF